MAYESRIIIVDKHTHNYKENSYIYAEYIAEIKITRYQSNENFFVDVELNGETVEFYLFHKDYSTKEYMFGLNYDDCPEEKWRKIIENVAEDYTQDYLYNRTREQDERIIPF